MNQVDVATVIIPTDSL